MNRTRILFNIFLILLVSFISYIIYLNYETLSKNLKLLMIKFKEPEIIIPYEKTKYHNNYNLLTVKETNNFKPQNMEDLKNIYYTVLNNGWDEFTFYCPKEYKNCANDVRKLANKDDYIVSLNNFVSPYNSYIRYNTLLTNETEVYLTIEKLYTKDEIININNEINRIFKELNISKDKNNKYNIKKIHDYLIENISYDENYTQNTETLSNKASTALFDKIALCSGYSDAFALMLDKLNIPNFKVSNKDHVWNAIYIDNKWLHIDVTWDDDEKNKNNNYNFYLITTDELYEKDNDTHAFDRNLYLELK